MPDRELDARAVAQAGSAGECPQPPAVDRSAGEARDPAHPRPPRPADAAPGLAPGDHHPPDARAAGTPVGDAQVGDPSASSDRQGGGSAAAAGTAATPSISRRVRPSPAWGPVSQSVAP